MAAGHGEGELIGCFGLTEPEAGSDPASMTRPRAATAAAGCIDGAKRWIGLASIADIAVIWARTDDGVRGFLVPTSTPGFTATPIEPKLAMRASIQCDIALERRPAAGRCHPPGGRGAARAVGLPERGALRDHVGRDGRCP